MKTLITTIFCMGLLVLIGCNRKMVSQENPPAFTDKQYIITLNDAYNMKALRSTLGSKISKIAPSSKSQNVYLITLTEVMTIDELLAYPIVIKATRPNKELDEPSITQPVKKGTSAPIIKQR